MKEEEMWTNISLMCVFFFVRSYVRFRKEKYILLRGFRVVLSSISKWLHTRDVSVRCVSLPHNFGRLLMPLFSHYADRRALCFVCVGQIVRAQLTIIDVFNEIFICGIFVYGGTSARQDCKQTLVYWIGLCVGWLWPTRAQTYALSLAFDDSLSTMFVLRLDRTQVWVWNSILFLQCF